MRATFDIDVAPLDVLARGAALLAVNHVHPLAEAVEAHRALEAIETTGSPVLLPWA